MTFNHRSAYNIFVHLASLALVVVVLVVSRENHRLEARLDAQLEASTITVAGSRIADDAARGSTNGAEVSISGIAGAPLPAMPVRNLTGRASYLSFEDHARPSVLLVFGPSCASCGENLPRWQELYERYREHYRIIGISIEDRASTQAYAMANALPFPIVLPEDSSEFIAAYGITHVPMTLVTNADGYATHARAGVLPISFATDLPGIVPAS